jgi:hypothetical protein
MVPMTRNLPKLGKLYSVRPRWWQKPASESLKLETFHRPEPSSKENDEARYALLADIALRRKPRNKAA